MAASGGCGARARRLRPRTAAARSQKSPCVPELVPAASARTRRTVVSLFKLRSLVFSNRTVHDAAATVDGGGRHMHMVDYGLSYGFQWSGLLRVLAAREGCPPELVMITDMDLPQTAAGVDEKCRVLEAFALNVC